MKIERDFRKLEDEISSIRNLCATLIPLGSLAKKMKDPDDILILRSLVVTTLEGYEDIIKKFGKKGKITIERPKYVR